MKKFFILMITCLSVFGFVSCDTDAGGGGSPDEFDKYEVNIINSYWDGKVHYMGASYSVTLRIPDAKNYIFYLNGYEDDRGTYSRNFNTATLVSNDSKGKVIGKAIITGPDTVYVSLNSNAGYPGASGTATRRK